MAIIRFVQESSLEKLAACKQRKGHICDPTPPSTRWEWRPVISEQELIYQNIGARKYRYSKPLIWCMLQPLAIPLGPWKSISLDFITDLSPSKGVDAILTVVDRFTKLAHFLPCMKAFTSEDTASLVLQEAFKHHGLPDDIICDRGPQFIS